MADRRAGWKVRVTERNIARGLQAPCDLEDIREFGYLRPPGPSVPLPDLLRHVAVHYNEYQLRNDLDCVLSLCATEADRREVRKLARARLAGKPYQAPEMAVTLSGAECASCGKHFPAKRADARFCSARCRQRGRRRNAPGVSRIAR